MKDKIELTENAIKVLEKRYLKKDDEGNVTETPEEMFRRVANHVAQNEKEKDKWSEIFYQLMSSLTFLPNSPTLRHFGATKGCGSACFVLPIEDSRESIFQTLADAAKVQSAGGGTGYSFSKLRPTRSKVGGTGAVSSGPISFMSCYDHDIGEIIRQGGVRDGAQMGIFRCDHPNIMEFINCKKIEGRFSNFNISVTITDNFMRSLENDEEFELSWIGKIAEKQEKISAIVQAKEIWNAIIEGAWTNGEPGIMFIDTVNRLNPLNEFEIIEACNPCGEQPLPPYQSCNLGSINLAKMWNLRRKRFDWELFEQTIRNSVRFLDNVIDVNKYPLLKIEEKTKKTRRIGLGVMGFADLLIKLKFKYSSTNVIPLSEDISRKLYFAALDESEKIGKEKGNIEYVNRRNGTLLSIAPTGTLSIIADCSSGIEPNFDFDYEKIAIGTKLKIVPPLFKPFVENGEKFPEYFETMKDIPPEQHVKILAAWQKYVDAGISKTINAPNSTTKEEVDELFRMAHKTGCKAVTFYRDGSRKIQALTSVSKEELDKKERPKKLSGVTEKIKTGYGSMYLTMNRLDDSEELREVFTLIGMAGADVGCMTEAIGRLISLARKYKIAVREIVGQLKGIGGEKPLITQHGLVRSIPDAIGKAIEGNFCQNKQDKVDSGFVLKCPVCRELLTVAEGCVMCKACGYDKCGG